ncbi:hypothetical protein QU481_15565 [Crenobacter sp. SG2303]|uniref:Uncharacterized protein n=1 Tax=Crenobacter oryzisoli TaxID=3056844 RepID=A0ABT7XMS7_9NEIS|nr:hypothetical protein [Crenobacter sp. SG2303]MDN0075089.1 hypothetical protein [Crenobacter sp. SG2303]MDN0076303.1 hypothetical protein [Crenobacter sp. SG2303]
MSGYSNSPKVLKGGLVLIDPTSAQVQRIIALQYNPDSLTRSFQVQSVGGEGSNRSDVMRLKGPAVESYKLDAEIDAADQLEFPDQNRATVEHGIQPQLAALELLLYPTSSQLNTNNNLANAGTLEIVPMETPLALFVWSKTRIVPVRVTDFSITEEAFDPALNPLRAKVSLGLRVLSVDDLGFAHKGGSLFMNYLQTKEQLAGMAAAGQFSMLGIGGIP